MLPIVTCLCLFRVLSHWRTRRQPRAYCRSSKYNRIPRQRMHFWKEFEYLTDTEFIMHYRMSKRAFRILLDVLRPLLTPSRKIWDRNRGKFTGPNLLHEEYYYIPPEIKLSIGLRFLAGGRELDIHRLHGISTSASIKARNAVILAILHTPSIGPVILKLQDEDYLSEKTRLFVKARPSNPLASHCIGAIDGLGIQIHDPQSHVINPNDYYNRKGSILFFLNKYLFTRMKRFLFYQLPGHM
jgi:hypothetical protein